MRAIINSEVTNQETGNKIYHVYTLNDNNNLLAGFTYRDYFYNMTDAINYIDCNPDYELFLILDTE